MNRPLGPGSSNTDGEMGTVCLEDGHCLILNYTADHHTESGAVPITHPSCARTGEDAQGSIKGREKGARNGALMPSPGLSVPPYGGRWQSRSVSRVTPQQNVG